MSGTAPAPVLGPGAPGAGSAYDLTSAERIIATAKVTSLITRLAAPPATLATQNNALQELAERGRLGIPLTISTDPRHHFQQTAGASVAPGGFSQWPETLGFAALRDPPLVDAVRTGIVPASRLDTSVRRLLLQKLQQGLFEHPFVDPEAAIGVVGSAEFRAEADAAQRRAMVLIENAKQGVPLKAGTKVLLHGVDAAAARAVGLEPVARVQDAAVALLRLETPFEVEHPSHFFGQRQHEGRLDFRDGDTAYEVLKDAAARIPTVVAITLDRPAVLTNVRDKAVAIIGTFGASDAALLDVVTGRTRAEGHLPFALPRSMADIEVQSPGRPHDLASSLYPFGWPR